MKRENGAKTEDKGEEIGLGKKFGLLYGVCLIVGTMIGRVLYIHNYF